MAVIQSMRASRFNLSRSWRRRHVFFPIRRQVRISQKSPEPQAPLASSSRLDHPCHVRCEGDRGR